MNDKSIPLNTIKFITFAQSLHKKFYICQTQ